MMVVAAYESLKNFNPAEANIPENYVASSKQHPLDPTIEAISNQFAINFKKELTKIAYQDFDEKLSY